jgi:DNA polymerase III subunit epsilon
MPMEEQRFSVFDVETTGLYPRHHDRVIEIGIVQIASNGEILDEYESLINPQRDIGPTRIHHIMSREVLNAPLFKDIAGSIVDRLKGFVVGAHNALFDVRFVQAEFSRIAAPIPAFPTVCTMRLAMKAVPHLPGRNLSAICQYFGIPMGNRHAALDDARAAALLLIKCRELLGSFDDCIDWQQTDATISKDWPVFESTQAPYPRCKAIIDVELQPSCIQEIILRLPSGPMMYECQQYYALLDRVLEDRKVTLEEKDALFCLAQEMGMSREQAVKAHEDYVRELIRLAREDGIVTTSESGDIDEVRRLLCITTDQMIEILNALDRTASFGVNPEILNEKSKDFVGKSVCFTGQMRSTYNGEPISREIAEKLATECGLSVNRSVTKQLDILVVVDPDSMSSKAKKAHEYGTRIIAESAFWRMVGIRVD